MNFKKSIIKEIADWALHIVLATIIAVLVTNFIIQRTIVNKTSMLPTLNNGDNLIVEKVSERFGHFKTGDIVTIYAPKFVQENGKTIIKRIVATQGDNVSIKNGKVYVNNKVIKEDYINGNFTRARGEFVKLKVRKGYVYVLGDNRIENILDSRIMGEVPIKDISGKAVVRIYPFGKIRLF